MLFYLVVLLCVFIYLLYSKINKVYTYWDKKGVKGPKPQFLIGNLKSILKKEESYHTLTSRLYEQYPDEKFVGMYFGLKPILILRDPELVKDILVKHFDSFIDRPLVRTNEPQIVNLLNEKGEKWRALRKKLTPMFTTAKLKQMMPLINNCIDHYLRYVDGLVDEGGPREIKDANMKYALKVITSVAFGLDIDTFSEQKSQFVNMAEKITEKTFRRAIVLLLENISPGLAEKLHIKIFTQDVHDFFMSITNQIVKEREGKPKTRKDFMDLMIEMKEQETISTTKQDDATDIEVTETMLAAQAFLFYTAGFDTSSNTSTLLLYELALNPAVQERCHEEVARVMDKYGGELPYEALADLQYLNMAFNETMRKHPITGVLPRLLVANTYKFAGTNMTIEKGTHLIIPVFLLQNDPKYFPDPDKFDPSKFCAGERGPYTQRHLHAFRRRT